MLTISTKYTYYHRSVLELSQTDTEQLIVKGSYDNPLQKDKMRKYRQTKITLWEIWKPFKNLQQARRHPIKKRLNSKQ